MTAWIESDPVFFPNVPVALGLVGIFVGESVSIVITDEVEWMRDSPFD